MTRTLLIAAFLMAALAMAATVAAAAPPGPPPKVRGASGAPPPGWVESGGVQKWLAFSSYCWKTTCVDFIPPTMRTGLPVLPVRRGEVAKLHLRFAPERLTVSVMTATGVGKLLRVSRVGRVASWRPKASGLVLVEADAAAGDASYVIRIRLR